MPEDIVKQNMPLDFKDKYPSTQMILDATEVPVQKPSNPTYQSATWSSYKNQNTIKTMVGITLRGVISYISPSYGGATSDRQIMERSSLVQEKPFAQGSSIMADRGILVQDLFASQGVQVNTPTTMRGKNQLEADVVIKDRRISSKRVHVERVIGLAKRFKILEGLTSNLRPLGSKITYVCFVLVNFKPCIVSKYN